MVKIHRIWFNTERMDREDHYKITLFSRPRVSIHVDEYIWSFIEENIVKLQEQKAELAEQILGGDNIGTPFFSREELLELLQ